jgi:hypothetical protein
MSKTRLTSLEQKGERLEMSYILDALKKAEQKTQREKAPIPDAVEPAVASPAWEVKMVSPARYTRFRLKEGEGDAVEQKGSGLPKGVGIAAAVLALLLLLECVLLYDNRARMSVIATEAARLTRQMSETETLLTKREGERLNLKTENSSLRQELDVVNTDLAQARDAVEKLKVREQRPAAKKRQPTVAEQKRPEALPFAFAPPPPMFYRPPGTERPPELAMVDTATVKTYSIR